MINTTRVIRLEREGPTGTKLELLDLNPADFQSALPEQRWHVYFQDPKIGLTVGVWTTTDMQEAFGPYPGDEFMLVLEGRVEMIDGSGKSTPIETGQSFAVRNAVPTSWKQVGPMRKFFILLDPKGPKPHVDSAEGGVIVMDPDALADRMTAVASPVGGGIQKEIKAFTNDAGTMTVGMCETTSFRTDMCPSNSHSFYQILDGEVSLTEENGVQQVFTTGDVFFVPEETVCRWEASETVRHYYASVIA